MLEGISGGLAILLIQAILAHLLNRHQAVTKLRIKGLIDSSEATLSYICQDDIPLLEHMLRLQQSRDRRTAYGQLEGGIHVCVQRIG